MVPQEHGIFGQTASSALSDVERQRSRTPVWQAILGACVLLVCSITARADTLPCQDTLLRFLVEMYRNGSYCTCAALHQERVTETGRIRRSVQYTLPGLPLPQGAWVPDLSRVQARFWGTIVDGPGGQYALSMRIYEEGREAEALVRRLKPIKQGQEFEITAGPQQRMLLRMHASYHVMVEGQNPQLRPQQHLTVQGRACFYLASDS